jgi:acyl-coenzyme A thioesterase PaaI-like protein
MADADPEAIDFLTLLRGVNETAPFNRWAGFVVSAAGDGTAELRLPWRAELGQYSGFLVRAGKRQVFTTAELFAERDGASKLVATGTTVLAVSA